GHFQNQKPATYTPPMRSKCPVSPPAIPHRIFLAPSFTFSHRFQYIGCQILLCGRINLFFLYSDDAVNYKICIPAPWQFAEILPVMQLNDLAAGNHQTLGDLFVFNREIELIRLQSSRLIGTKTGLYQLSLVGFEYYPFVDEIVQLSRFHAGAKDIVVADINEYCQ